MSLAQSRKQRIHSEIAAFAAEYRGSELDLDEDLERAGIEALKGLAEPADRIAAGRRSAGLEAAIRTAIDLDR